MELQLNTRNVGIMETVFDGKLEQAVDSDVTLPEYCPDILRILKCSVEPAVHAAQAAGERVTVEGSARVNVIYAAEDGSMQCFEQSYPFSRTADINGLTEPAAVSAQVRTQYANSRAVSQRRLDIHAMLGIHLTARRKKLDDILIGASGAGIQILTETVQLSSLEALGETSFPMTEVIEVEANAPAVDQVIHRRAVALATEIKAIKNKLLLKGNLEVRVIYRSRDAKEPVQVLHSMPISQIIEAPGLSEESANTLRLGLQSLDVTPKADANGALRLLEIAARVSAQLKGYQSMEFPVLADAYSTIGAVTLDTRKLETRQLLESFQDSFTARQSFELEGGIQSVQLLTGELPPSKTNVKNDALETEGAVQLHLVYRNKEGELAAAEKELPFTFRRPLRRNGTHIRCDVAFSLVSAQESISGDHLELRAELVAAGDIYLTQSRKTVGNITAAEEEDALKRSPLTIYFSGDQEPLWEIARRYRTTMDAIRLENELSGDTAAEGQMLLIPAI
ncbi:MAG: DUF3794 domain-containing protein [Oscillospiraceae bacterium]|jgi:hypothetical protein|nr:DUF3794 domain-containing protein [Oscillospiraceae bacterium]